MNNNILNCVDKYTKLFLENFSMLSAPVTEIISSDLRIDRTIVSKQLNKLFKNGKLVKINTRPVVYLHLENITLNKSKYLSVEDFRKDYILEKKNNVLEKIIGWNGSLRSPIDQIKASLLYPNNGLPAIIFGESGTGKSFIVQQAFKYAQSIHLLNESAKLVIINCAQYANNPELLSSLLFGYVRGAFTGAINDKAGAIESANNGILFLDEVHRLSASGQEKLFTYMDTGSYSPVGDDSKIVHSKTRLMFATTEDESTFLETFLRRVPIKIKLPSLDHRGVFEKRSLINEFFRSESKSIQKRIFVSNQCLNKLYIYNYKANVGEVKNLVKNIVANKYSEDINSKEIYIKLIDLPPKISGYNGESTFGNQNINLNKNSFFKFDGNESLLKDNDDNQSIYYKMRMTWNYIKMMDEKHVLSRRKYIQIIFDMTRHILYSLTLQEKELVNNISKSIQDILDIMNFDDLNLNNSSIYDLALYIYYLMGVNKENNSSVNNDKISFELSQLFSKEINLIKRLLPLLKGRFEIELSDRDLFWLSVLISKNDLSNVTETPGIIMSHGYATASSMADTCNRFLKSPVFYSIDMKPDISENSMVNELKKVINSMNPQNGIIILIDMGSLNTIVRKVKKFYSFPILIISNVSTPMALDVGNKILNNNSFKSIGEDVKKIVPDSTLFNQNAVKDNVIITTCMTGMGTAKRIEKILNNSFKGIRNIRIMAFDYHELVNYKRVDLFSKINILAIVGVDNPNITGVPYFGLEEIISGEKISGLKKVLSQVVPQEQLMSIEPQLVKNFSLNRIIDSLTIISPDKVMPLIENYIDKLKNDLNFNLSNRIQIALYVHIASMVERVIRGNDIKLYNGNNDNIIRDKSFSVIKKDISVIQKAFSINVNDTEIAYIRDIVVNL